MRLGRQRKVISGRGVLPVLLLVLLLVFVLGLGTEIAPDKRQSDEVVGVVVLPAGTTINVRLQNGIYDDQKSGEFSSRCSRTVESEGQVVLPRGAPGVGQYRLQPGQDDTVEAIMQLTEVTVRSTRVELTTEPLMMVLPRSGFLPGTVLVFTLVQAAEFPGT